MAAATGAAAAGLERAMEGRGTAEKAAAAEAGREAMSDGDSLEEPARDEAGGTVAPGACVRAVEKVLTVREQWCLRETGAFPSAEAAASAGMAAIEEAWGDSGRLSGPTNILRAFVRNEDRFAPPLATGVVEVLRQPFDGWEVCSLPKLKANMWQLQSSVEECVVVKAFDRASNHAKEMNWLLVAVERFLAAGGELSKGFAQIIMGYTTLRDQHARDNGPEWNGGIYGVNLSMDEVIQVVGWASAQYKVKPWSLAQELTLDSSGRRVLSSAGSTQAGCRYFRSADQVVGSATVYVESSLDISDFELGEEEELPGLAILIAALGKESIIDVEPSTRGLAGKGTVKLRIKCPIRGEKALRSRIKKLVRGTAEKGERMVFETSVGAIPVIFHSILTASKVGSGDVGSGGPGARGRQGEVDAAELRRREAIMEDLQAYQVKSAATLDQVVEQVKNLALQHEQSQVLARQVHASLAHEQATALNTVNQLASVFTSFMEREANANRRLQAPSTSADTEDRRVTCAPPSGREAGCGMDSSMILIPPPRSWTQVPASGADGGGRGGAEYGRGEAVGGRLQETADVGLGRPWARRGRDDMVAEARGEQFRDPLDSAVKTRVSDRLWACLFGLGHGGWGWGCCGIKLLQIKGFKWLLRVMLCCSLFVNGHARSCSSAWGGGGMALHRMQNENSCPDWSCDRRSAKVECGSWGWMDWNSGGRGGVVPRGQQLGGRGAHWSTSGMAGWARFSWCGVALVGPSEMDKLGVTNGNVSCGGAAWDVDVREKGDGVGRGGDSLWGGRCWDGHEEWGGEVRVGKGGSGHTNGARTARSRIDEGIGPREFRTEARSRSVPTAWSDDQKGSRGRASDDDHVEHRVSPASEDSMLAGAETGPVSGKRLSNQTGHCRLVLCEDGEEHRRGLAAARARSALQDGGSCTRRGCSGCAGRRGEFASFRMAQVAPETASIHPSGPQGGQEAVESKRFVACRQQRGCFNADTRRGGRYFRSLPPSVGRCGANSAEPTHIGSEQMRRRQAPSSPQRGATSGAEGPWTDRGQRVGDETEGRGLRERVDPAADFQRSRAGAGQAELPRQGRVAMAGAGVERGWRPENHVSSQATRAAWEGNGGRTWPSSRLEANTGEYLDRQQRTKSGSPVTNGGRRHISAGVISSGLGVYDGGSSGGGAPSPRGAENRRGRGCTQSGWSGCPLWSCQGGPDRGAGAAFYPTGVVNGEVCVAPFRYRLRGSGPARSGWEEDGLRVGGRGQQDRSKGVDGGLGRHDQGSEGQRAQRGHCSGPSWSSRRRRHPDDKLALRPLVSGEYTLSSIRRACLPSRQGLGRVPGSTSDDSNSTTKGHHPGMRGRWTAKGPSRKMGTASWAYLAAAGMGVVLATYLLQGHVARLCSAPARVVCGSAETAVRAGNATTGRVVVPGQGGSAPQVAHRLRLRGGGDPVRSDRGTPAGEGGDTAPASFSGRCLCWNARQLLFSVQAGDEESSSMPANRAQSKLEFLQQQIDWFDPWLVAVMEVSGGLPHIKGLRAWFRKRGFPETVFQLGEGGSLGTTTDGASPSLTNGLVVALRKDLSVVTVQRLSFRTLAVSIRHKQSQAVMSIVLLHGSSREGRAGAGSDDETSAGGSFCTQLAVAAEWCERRDGVILMDANRTPCRNWRSPAPAALSRGDKALRKLARWSCSCCDDVTCHDTDGTDAALVGSQLTSVGGTPIWTRWGTPAGWGRDVCKSRLDFALAFGRARTLWDAEEAVPPLLTEGNEVVRVSDHALVAYSVKVRATGTTGELRPLPVRLGPCPRKDRGPTHGSAWWQLGRHTHETTFLERLRAALHKADKEGSSQVQAIVPLLREAGERAVSDAAICTQRDKMDARRRATFDDKSEAASWKTRLAVTKQILRTGRLPSNSEWLVLFHPRGGLRKFAKGKKRDEAQEIDWRAVLARCGRQARRAEDRLAKGRRRDDEWLASRCRSIEEAVGDGDLSSHVRTIWRLIGPKGDGSKMFALHRGDKKDAPTLSTDDPEFLAEAGRIGELFVREVDRGAVPSVFKAWLEVFGSRLREVPGSRGEWNLRKEFTYEVFGRILRSMRGKAVGAGGLSVELLLAAASEVRWLFYNALLLDVERGRIAPAWRRVIYVLLRKPPPNDAAIVAQRREIALMPQDLKIVLQGVRLTAFARVSDQLDVAQYGWKQGVGCAEPSLALAGALDQAKRLKHKAWLLYIDLACFFPAIQRAIATDCELFHGLPEAVTQLMGQIYGGQGGEPVHVQCQYETGAGLGAPFLNGMGRLMGCPVSPDSAKILLNSVLVAIKASVTGMLLWPFTGAEVSQVAFADDWLGIFDDVGQLRKALAIWLTWAEAVGARLGVKGLIKTVVSGVDHSSGKAVTPADPGLFDLEGARIPLLSCGDLYKHLGVPRAANADGYLSWTGNGRVTGIRDKLLAGVRRLKRLKPGHTTLEQFMCISNVLMGGLGGFYLQAVVVSLDELETVEKEWRRVFNKFAKRDPTAHALTPYYPGAAWQKGRVHLARIGLAAMYAAVGKVLSDVERSPAQDVIQSAVALSLHRWGCRSDPGKWSWSHLREALEKATRGRGGTRYIGDAWMLACLILEDKRCPSVCRKQRAEQLRTDLWGRWVQGGGQAGQRRGPLDADAAWWKAESRLLFEPCAQGGCGLNPMSALLLLRDGVAEVGSLCSHPFVNSGEAGRWLFDRKAVETRFDVRVSEAWWKQWVATVNALRSRGVHPGGPESGAATARRRYPRRKRERPELEKVKLVARWVKRQRVGDTWPAEVEEAERRLREAFKPVRMTRESSAEGTARQGTREGCRGETTIGWCLDKDGSEQFIQWGCIPRDELPARLTKEWTRAAQEWSSAIEFRKGDGWPVCSSSGAEVTTDDAQQFPPAPQLALRARLRLGKDAPTVPKGYGEKLSGVKVAEDVQVANWKRFCELQARFNFTHAFATDGSEGEVPPKDGESRVDEWGWANRLTAAAAVAHSGETWGGCVPVRIPSDSYVGELRALIVALKAVPAGSRVFILLDSTSPVLAWARFRRRSLRARRQFKEAALLARLEELVNRQQLVFLQWQRSHCGSPANEMADQEAERLRMEGQVWLQVEEGAADLMEMWPSRVNGALFAWAIQASKPAIHGWLEGKHAQGLTPREDDWVLGGFRGAFGAVAGLMREEKLMAVDRGHVLGKREREAAAQGGCVACGAPTPSSWHHYVFDCQLPRLCTARSVWRASVIRLRPEWDYMALQNQVTALLGLLAPKGPGVGSSLRNREEDLLDIRRLLSGLVTQPAGARGGAAGGEQKAAQETVLGGLRLLRVAVRADARARAEVERSCDDNRLLRRVLNSWLRVVVVNGPVRVAALRQIRQLNIGACLAYTLAREEGCEDGDLLQRNVRGIRKLLREARAEVDVFCPPLDEEAAVCWWYIQMRWWGRWAKAEGSVVRRTWEAWTPAGARAVLALDAWWPGLMHLEFGWVSDDTESGGDDRSDLRAALCSGGWAEDVVRADRWFARACRAFLRLGGRRKLRKIGAELRKCGEAKRWERMSRHLETFLQSGSCTGRAPPVIDDSEKITVVIPARTRSRGTTLKRRRSWEQGREADKRGRWAIQEVLQARRCTEGAGWEALVDWAGGAHAPSWVRVAELNEAARREARTLIDVCKREEHTIKSRIREERRQRFPDLLVKGREREGARQGVRKSPRLPEAAARRERRNQAIVRFEPPAPKKRTQRSRRGMFAVKRVWHPHLVDGVEYVHVEWEHAEDTCPNSIPVAWLSEDLRANLPNEAPQRSLLPSSTAGCSRDSEPDRMPGEGRRWW